MSEEVYLFGVKRLRIKRDAETAANERAERRRRRHRRHAQRTLDQHRGRDSRRP